MRARPQPKMMVEDFDARIAAAFSGQKYWSPHPEVVLLEEGLGCLIRCEVVDPPSAVGRSVNVWIPADTVANLMKELRTVAIAQRSRTMKEAG